ncbi:hypothetical protein ABPG77_007154 [Micractinium sp. CCAP 211/92]
MSGPTGGAAGTSATPPVHERAALAIAGLACGVYLMHSLPAILFPSGMLASVLTLLAGVLLGLAVAAGGLAAAFFQLTKPGRASTTSRPLQPAARGRQSSGHSGAGATSPGATLPHAIALRGTLSGVVYTAPASVWRRTDTLGNWPPSCDPSQPFRAWEASLAQGTLVLRPIVPPPGAKPPSPGRSSAAKQQGTAEVASSAGGTNDGAARTEAATAAGTAAPGPGSAATPAPALTKVGIPLEGCTVELVTDGLQGRSNWIRRAPLLIRHPKWNLLEGEPAFFLWADDPAAKQQWLHALGWWCQDGERLAAIDAMYTAYCQAMRDRSCLEYAEQAPPADDGQASSAAEASTPGLALAVAAAVQPQRKAGWKGWGSSKVQSMRRRMQERRGRGATGVDDAAAPDGEPLAGLEAGTAASAAAAAAAAPRSRAGSALPSAAASPAKPPLAAAELQSLDSIMEAKWMQSRKIQVPPAVTEAVVRSRHTSRPSSHASSPTAMPRISHSSAGAELPGWPGTLGGSAGGGSALGSMPSDGLGTPVQGGSPVAAGGASPFRLSSAAAAAGLPPGSPLVAAGVALRTHSRQSEVGRGEEAGGAAGAGPASAAEGVADPLPEGLPPLLSPDYAVNAFVTRLAFDLLRRPDFQEYVRSRVQRQLSRLQRPDFITALEVVAVDPGGAAPTLRNIRALPQPEASIWPQVLFDMRYQGAFTVTIELKVDIRDAAAWGRLDQALTRLAEGKKRPGSGGGGGSLEHPPPHAASAPSLGGVEVLGEEEAEGEGFEDPASPDSSASGSAAAAAGDGPAGEQPRHGAGGKGPRRGMLNGLRLYSARKLRQLAENTAQHISRIPLRLSLTFSLLEGTMCAWVPPPPGNRAFYSFVAPPRLELTARPELAGRLLKYSYHVARVSHWIEQRMRAAITRNMVFPGGGDLVLLPLMALDHPNAADSLPSLRGYAQQAAAAAAAREQVQQEGEEGEEQQRAAAEEEEAQAGVLYGGASTVQLEPAAALPNPESQAADADTADAATKADTDVGGLAAAAAAAAAAATGGGQAAAAWQQQPAQRGLASAALLVSPWEGRPTEQTVPAARTAEEHLQLLHSSSQEELPGEPSLSLAGTPQAFALAAGTAACAAQAAGDGNGHLISPRYDSAARQASAGPSVAADAAAAEVGSPLASLNFDAGGRGRSAADAWDAAMAQEGRPANEAPTPRLASQRWQLPLQPASAPLQAGLGLGSVQQQAQKGGARPAPDPAGPAARGAQQPRPSLQLKLSTSRSLDPDFTTSAEHTGFGEAPASALPNYRPMRRSLSARGDAAGGSPVLAPGSARSSPEAVGEAISRSLASLRRQNSSLKQQQAAEAAAHAGHILAQQQQQQQAQQQAAQQPQAGSRPGSAAGSPGQEGSSRGPADDPRRLRQSGSFKEQAGKLCKFFNRMNAAGKALASQMHDMQQQRAAARLSRSGSTPGSGSGSARHPQSSGGGIGQSPFHHTPSQLDAL